jgi:hypothetical protein
MKKVNFILAICLMTAISMFTSCTKDDVTPSSNSSIADAQDNSIASSSFDDAITEVDQALGGSFKSADDETPVITTIYWRKGEFRKEIVFNGITRRGKVRSGKIIVTVTYPVIGDTLNKENWVKTITFDDYKVGGRQIEGTKTITFIGLVDGFPTWNITLVGGKVTFANGKFITFEFTRTRKMIEGSETPLILEDDVYEINGNGNGTNRKGIAFTTTSTDLIKEVGCPYFRSGTVVYETVNKTITIVYNGGDSCGTSATITVDGKTETIDSDTESN